MLFSFLFILHNEYISLVLFFSSPFDACFVALRGRVKFQDILFLVRLQESMGLQSDTVVVV